MIPVLAFAAAATVFAGPVRAATPDRVVTSPQTGLAIDGIDPVGYFTNGEPLQGRPQFEFRHQGVVWRFRNEGNKAAFARSPEVYTPRFGGYDPVAIARGVAVAGNPLVWAIRSQRLYMFFSTAARGQFLADGDKILPEAEARWPTVAAGVIP